MGFIHQNLNLTKTLVLPSQIGEKGKFTDTCFQLRDSLKKSSVLEPKTVKKALCNKI